MLVNKGGTRLVNKGHNSGNMLNIFKSSCEFYFTERSKAMNFIY